MHQLPENVESIVMAACVLHNLLSLRNPHPFIPDPEDPRAVGHDWRSGPTLDGVRGMAGNTQTKQGKAVRMYLKEYYNSEAGSVPWQDDMI